jgi:hypothetical protein
MQKKNTAGAGSLIQVEEVGFYNQDKSVIYVSDPYGAPHSPALTVLP